MKDKGILTYNLSELSFVAEENHNPLLPIIATILID
jgi:hypothetical protein